MNAVWSRGIRVFLALPIVGWVGLGLVERLDRGGVGIVVAGVLLLALLFLDWIAEMEKP